MESVTEARKGETADDLSAFIDTERFWVIWQVRLPERGGNCIRRISQDYRTEARAEADAERYRKSGAITWVEEARPLAPAHVPAAALGALRGDVAPTPRDGVTPIGGQTS
jgi:hypothetical protein